jgi:hypothetical protein
VSGRPVLLVLGQRAVLLSLLSVYVVTDLCECDGNNRKFNLPIIADEIYGGCVFDGEFTSVSSVSGDVPVLVVGGGWVPCLLFLLPACLPSIA